MSLYCDTSFLRNMVKFIDFKNRITKLSNVFCIVRNIDERDSKAGKYLVFTLFDGDQEIQARMWNNTLSSINVKKDDVVNVYLEAKEYNGSLTYVVNNIDVTNKYTKSDFLVKAPIDAQIMYDYIFTEIENIKDITLNYIAKKLYIEYKNELLIWPAAKRFHHDVQSGLLYHVYRMLKSGEAIVENSYQDLDIELVKVGIILHDIGKILEMKPTETGNGEYTIDGELFGHLYLGMRMIANVANTKEIDVDQNKVKHLLHIIASHHGTYEFGAIALPKTKEAYLVSQIDMIDSRLYVYEKNDNALKQGEFNTEFVKI